MGKKADREISSADTLAVAVKSGPILSTKFNASGMLWWNAALFADLCEKLETAHQADFFRRGEWKPNDRVMKEHRAFSVAAVMHSMSALEAGINEFYHELLSGDSGRAKPVDAKTRDLLLHSWPLLKKDHGQKTLDKYNWALSTAGKPEFDLGSPPAQGFSLLRRLRNAIVHYRPEWSHENGDHAALEKSISGQFPQSALMPTNMSWFPGRCFGAGCASWAVGVAESFMSEFCGRMGIVFWFDGNRYGPTPPCGEPES